MVGGLQQFALAPNDPVWDDLTNSRVVSFAFGGKKAEIGFTEK